MNNRIRLGILFSIIGIIFLCVGISYSFFYRGLDEVSKSPSGKITFVYTGVAGAGNKINLTESIPVSDEVGKKQIVSENYLDFKIISSISNYYNIPYEITVRKQKDSVLDDTLVKVYLTELSETGEKELFLTTFDALKQTEKINVEKYIEKTLYQNNISPNSSNYEKSFRLRMWIDSSKVNNFDNGILQTFVVTVNVYANGAVVINEQANN